MRIAILSRNRKLYSIRRLIEEFQKLNVECHIIDPLECQLVIKGKESRVMYGSRLLPHFDAIIPRIGASITEYGLSVVRHFEMQKTVTLNGSRAIAESRDKMRCLQVLTEAGILVPATVLTHNTRSLKAAVEAVRGFPVVIKILQGTQGVGVMLVHTPISLGSVLDTLRTLEQDAMIQQFIVEGAGRDLRAFVVGNRVVAAMKRTAPKGEFRSNIHRGAKAEFVELSQEYKRVAIRAAQTLGLQIAGVDLMESHDGPLVIEVNSSPGFEGIEKATQYNVAQAIAEFTYSKAKKAQRKSKPQRKSRRRSL